MVNSQEYGFWENPIHKLTNGINEELEWTALLQLVKNDSILNAEDYASDISETIKLLSKEKKSNNLIDKFLISICKQRNISFYLNQSGNLGNSYANYNSKNVEFYYEEKEGIEINIKEYSRSNFRFNRILKSESNKIIPDLIRYLSNHSATRQTIPSRDWDDVPFYLSVSDIAMELLEVYTLCDFYNNASYPNSLFSNQSIEKQTDIINTITKWWSSNKMKNKLEGATYFLDSISNIGYSYTLTCNNILHYGDTLLAKQKYQQYYEDFKLPCRTDHRVGTILYELNDSRLMDDCLHDIYDYRCMVENGSKCVSFIFEKPISNIQFDVLADIVRTEKKSRYRIHQNKYVWHHIFNEMAKTQNKWTETILLELMAIKDVVKGSRIKSYDWERNYKSQFEEGYRVCDFALLKYCEMFSLKNNEVDWKNKDSVNKQIRAILDKNGD